MVGGCVERWIRERINGLMSTWMEEWIDESRLESISKICTFSCITEFAKNERPGLTGVSHSWKVATEVVSSSGKKHGL